MSRGPCPKTSSSSRHLCTAASAGCPRRDSGQVARSPRSPRRAPRDLPASSSPSSAPARPAAAPRALLPARRCRSPRPSGPSSLGLPPPGTRSPQLSTHSLPRFLLSTVRAKRSLRLPPSPLTRLIKILKNNTDSCIPFARLANNSVFSSHLEGPSCGSLTTPSPLHAPPNTPRYPPPASETRLHVPAVPASCGSPGCTPLLTLVLLLAPCQRPSAGIQTPLKTSLQRAAATGRLLGVSGGRVGLPPLPSQLRSQLCESRALTGLPMSHPQKQGR